MSSDNKPILTNDEEEEVDVDDRDAPNTYPYKKCAECEERKSCGNYHDSVWLCEDCGGCEEEEEEEEEAAVDTKN